MVTKKILIILAVVLFAGTGLYAFPNKIFTSSGYIFPGEKWNTVSIYNDDTVVTMLGGMADFISTFDRSTLNAIYGQTGVGAFDYSIINIYGGTHWTAIASYHGTVNFSSDAVSQGLSASGFGVTNMFGGTVGHLGAHDSGTINIYAGSITDYIFADDYSTINIFGNDLIKTDSDGIYGFGKVEGYLTDLTYISVDFVNPEAYSHINLIPEPATFALLSIGGLLLKKRKL
jgi:hypothetical protein